MDLETKVRKMKLKLLTDDIRYEVALDKSKAHLYNKYDYYKECTRCGVEVFSKKYLKENSYRQLKKDHRRSHSKDLRGIWNRYLFKLEVWFTVQCKRVRSKIMHMFGG